MSSPFGPEMGSPRKRSFPAQSGGVLAGAVHRRAAAWLTPSAERVGLDDQVEETLNSEFDRARVGGPAGRRSARLDGHPRTERAEAGRRRHRCVGGEWPGLGRPTVDTISNSTIANLKELRPGTVRILFVFDPYRSAILLVAGDKSGTWNRWYDTAIPLAEERYKAYLKERAEEEGTDG